MLHPDARRAVPPHRMPYQPTGQPVRDRPVMRVNVGDHIARDIVFKISGGDRTRIHRAVVHGLGIGQHDDHLFRALGESAFDSLWDVNFLAPLFSPDGITVQSIDDRVATGLLLPVTRRQEYEYVTINRISL